MLMRILFRYIMKNFSMPPTHIPYMHTFIIPTVYLRLHFTRNTPLPGLSFPALVRSCTCPSRAKVAILPGRCLKKVNLAPAPCPYLTIQGWPRSHSCYESRSSSLWLLKYDTRPPNSPVPSSSYCLFPGPASFGCPCCGGGWGCGGGGAWIGG